MQTTVAPPSNVQSKLYTIIAVFFFWGFVAASNGIFIPFCKAHFHLNQFQSQLIELAFYGAYFIGSIIFWLASQAVGYDILNRIGHKQGTIYGLGISVVGALSIIPAVNSGSFGFILGAFFVIALGFSLQQIAAQPYVIALGSPATGAHRTNLAAAVNSVGSLLGPLVMSVLLFGTVNADPTTASISSINVLYLILAGVFTFAAGFLAVAKMPKIVNEEAFEPGFGALRYPQLVWGMVGIFMYVGVEVTIQSNLGALLKKPAFGGYNEASISSFISLYWGSLLIGRLAGAISAFNLARATRQVLTVVLPFTGFGLILLVNVLKNNDVSQFPIYAVCVALLVVGTWLSQEKPFKMLLIFSLMGMLAMTVGLLTVGKLALYAFISGGLCCSVMWSCIFNAAIAGLGKYANQGSTFLIMMILGGALIPPLQGYLADLYDIHLSYVVPLLGFAYLAFFAVKVKSILAKQGLDYDTMQTGGGH